MNGFLFKWQIQDIKLILKVIIMKTSKIEVIIEIEIDILDLVYDNFPKLKRRLQHIAAKMRIINGMLSRSEIITLQENGYIHDFQNDFDY